MNWDDDERGLWCVFGVLLFALVVTLLISFFRVAPDDEAGLLSKLFGG